MTREVAKFKNVATLRLGRVERVFDFSTALEIAWAGYKRREFVRIGGRKIPFGVFEAVGWLAGVQLR